MKNKNRLLFWSLASLSLISAFGLLGCLSNFSQTDRRVYVSNTSNGSVTSNGSDVSNSDLQTNNSETKGSIILTEPIARQKRCGSGFSKIPSNLQETYLKQANQMKESDEPIKKDFSSENGVNFYGFTYPVAHSSEPENTEDNCGDEPTDLQQIHFVAPQINNLIKMYMLTITYNETEALNSKRKVIEGSKVINKIELCQDIDCNVETARLSKKSFDFSTLGDIEYAKFFSDTLIGVNALNEIRKISQSYNSTESLTDSEINQLLTTARRIAVSKIQ